MSLIEDKETLDRLIEDKNIRYFRSEEFLCKCGCGRVIIEDKLVVLLDALRDYIQKPVIITSAYRCPYHNRRVGGVPNSPHVHGLAIDIACTNSEDRFHIIKFLIGNGIGRIGIAKNYIHFDIDEEKPHPRIWHYYYRR